MGRVPCWAVLLAGSFSLSLSLSAAEPPPALTSRLARPDLQCERLLSLFEGTRASSPAAALAAWKRATGRTLGKPREALVSMFNPAMARELRTLDQATVVLGFRPDEGPLRWRATVPRDDGTFAALATALVLTDGAGLPPLGAAAIDRLGPAGAPLMARTTGLLALAGTREDLQAALAPDRSGLIGGPPIDSGCLFRINPDGWAGAEPIRLRQAAEAIRALGRDLDGVLRLEGETVSIEMTSRLDAPTSSLLDPAWLDSVPAGAAATVTIALDPSPTAWDRVFTWADRIVHADPANAGLAPLRTRLNLIALAAKVRLEVDLWPQLRGVTVTVLTDPEGEINGGLLSLHAIDASAAERLGRQVIPRLTASLAKAANRPLRIADRGATVLIGWGERALEEALDARDHPERSAGPVLRAAWGTSKPPQRAGAFWPGRLRNLAPADLPLAASLKEAPPVLWWGGNEDRNARDEVRWTGLRGLVRRFLERLPLDPPPDRGGPNE